MDQPCRLEYRGFHQLELVRCGGERIRIGGRWRILQEPPPNVASRPPVEEVQYIYATWDERRGRVRLRASTEGHEPAGGEEAMRGDPSALLVGMGRPYESRPQHYHWADRPAHRKFILSYYNRRPLEWRRGIGGDAAVRPGAWREIAPDLGVSFLAWGEEVVRVEVQGAAECAGGGATTTLLLGLGMDGAPPASADAEVAPGPSPGRFRLKLERRLPRAEEGFHSASLYGKTDAGVCVIRRDMAELAFSTMG